MRFTFSGVSRKMSVELLSIERILLGVLTNDWTSPRLRSDDIGQPRDVGDCAFRILQSVTVEWVN